MAVRVLMFQLKVRQQRDWQRSWVEYADVAPMMAHCFEIARRHQPDLVVFPETCYIAALDGEYRKLAQHSVVVAGSAYNAVAESAVLEGTTRFVSEETRARINPKITQLAQAISAQYGCRAEVTFADYSPSLHNDPSVCAELTALFQGLPGVEIVTDRQLRLGADDFADFLNLVPGAYIYIGTHGRPGTGVPHHNGHFDVDEQALLLGSQLLTRYALSRHQA